MIGGIEAVVWTDAIQVIVLLGGAIFAVIYISCSLPGGLGETIDIAVANGKFDVDCHYCRMFYPSYHLWDGPKYGAALSHYLFDERGTEECMDQCDTDCSRHTDFLLYRHCALCLLQGVS